MAICSPSELKALRRPNSSSGTCCCMAVDQATMATSIPTPATAAAPSTQSSGSPSPIAANGRKSPELVTTATSTSRCGFHSRQTNVPASSPAANAPCTSPQEPAPA